MSTLHTKYLRLSIIDVCNLQCYFCHNEGQQSTNNSLLNAEDIIWLANEAVGLGFTKFKITGGEPTLRKDLLEIIRGIKDSGVKDLSIITNGIRLNEICSDLYIAGLDRINVSLYSLNPNSFALATNGQPKQIENIIAGIDKAIDVGFKNLKINFLFNRASRINDLRQILDFACLRNIKVKVFPLLAKTSDKEDKVYCYDELFKIISSFGIKSTEILTDSEGFRQSQIETNSGAIVLLKLDILSEKYIFKHCSNCVNRFNCTEGILPLRISASGKIISCIASGISEIDILPIIKNRDYQKFYSTINNISRL